MVRPKVFVTRSIPDAGLQLIQDYCEAEVWQGEMPPPYEVLADRAKFAYGMLTLITDRIDHGIIDLAPRLKVISNLGVGVDNIDIHSATAHKIPVGNTPGVLTEATADMAFALLLSAARRIPEGERYVRGGNWKTWSPKLLLGIELNGSVLGIIGFGRIGQAVARRAQGFGLRVLFFDPTAQSAFGATAVDLDTLLRESDFVSLHIPLTERTQHMINSETLAVMKKSAILINTSRGPVVDHQALYTHLRSGQIFAAALDVTEPEPLPADSPLLQLENCLVIPHLGSASRQTRDKMASLAAQNLLAGLRGDRLPDCVNPEVYGK
jgi:glyoxylate reductase